MDMNEFWRSLGIDKDASPEQIKKAYRALVVIHHPDKPGGSADKFREVHHAYKMLTDPSYSYQNTPKETAVTIQTGITIEQAVFGATFKHNISKHNNQMPKKEGQIEAEVEHKVVCLIDQVPPRTLKFPYSINRTNVDFGDKKANVVVKYSLIEHEYYKVTGDGKILVEIEITAMEAIKGCRMDVQTLFGIRRLRVPAGTIPGDTFHIKKHGFLDPLIVKIAGIKYPRKAQLKTDPSYAGLNINWEKEDELDSKEQEDLDRIFNNLGGSPKKPS